MKMADKKQQKLLDALLIERDLLAQAIAQLEALLKGRRAKRQPITARTPRKKPLESSRPTTVAAGTRVTPSRARRTKKA